MGMSIVGSAVAFTQVKAEEIKPEIKAREIEIENKEVKSETKEK